MFEIGQQVVCINDSWYPVPENVAVRGGVYTIRGCRTYWNRGWLVFEELVNPQQPTLLGGMNEPHFIADHFRPVKKTNIEVFTKLTAPAPTKELENV
jgi:hypothetical protein